MKIIGYLCPECNKKIPVSDKAILIQANATEGVAIASFDWDPSTKCHECLTPLVAEPGTILDVSRVVIENFKYNIRIVGNPNIILGQLP